MHHPWLCVCLAFTPIACAANHSAVSDDGSGSEVNQSTSDGSEDGAATSKATASEGDSGPAMPPGAICGDGIVGDTEVCDDGINNGSYGGCAPDCAALSPYCGDGVTSHEEVCDDANAQDGDGCNVDCVASGTVLWTRQLSNTYFSDVAVDSDDGVAAVTIDGRLQRYDAEGSPGWFAQVSDRQATQVAYHPMAGWAIAGTIGEDVELDGWCRRYDLEGKSAAHFEYATAGADDVYGLTFDPLGHLYLVGTTSRGHDTIAWVRKHTSDGLEMWSRHIDGPADETDGFTDVVVTDDGLVRVLGTHELRQDSIVPLLQTYDGEGTPLSRMPMAPDAAAIYAGTKLFPNPAGGYALVGIRRLDLQLSLWANRYDGANTPGSLVTFDVEDRRVFGSGVAVDGAGSLVVVGTVYDALAADTAKIFVRKYDVDGKLSWQVTTAPEDGGSASASSVAVDAHDNIFVAGVWDTTSAGGSADAWIRKYSP